LETIGSNDFGL